MSFFCEIFEKNFSLTFECIIILESEKCLKKVKQFEQKTNKFEIRDK